MKNIFKVLGIISLTAVLSLGMIACDGLLGDLKDDGGKKDGEIDITVGNTSGKLTISDLGDFNGKYVIAMTGFSKDASVDDEGYHNPEDPIYGGGDGSKWSINSRDVLDEDYFLFAAADISKDGTITAGQIKSGSATLKLWKVTLGVNDDSLIFSDYTGSDQDAELGVIVCSQASVSIDFEIFAIATGIATVSFSNGTGSAAAEDMEEYGGNSSVGGDTSLNGVWCYVDNDGAVSDSDGIKFYGNQQVEMFGLGDDVTGAPVSWYLSGSYTIKGNQLIITFNLEGIFFTWTYTYSISGNTLTLIDEDGYTETYKRN
jgi:hypothetical protein